MFRIFSLWRQTALHSGLGRVYYEQPYPRNAWPSPASPHQPIAGLWAVYPSAANAQQSLRRRKLSPDVPAITQRMQVRPAGVFQPLAFFSSRTPTQGVIYLELSDRREHAWMTGQSPRPASPQGWWLLGRVDICLLTRGCPPQSHALAGPFTTELAMITSSAVISWQWTLKHMEVIVLNIFNKSL